MISFLLSFFFQLFQINYVNAVEPTPTVAQNDKVEDVKDILKQIVKDNSSEEDTTQTSNQPKSFFGTISQIDEKQIRITIQDKTKTIYFNDDTTFVNSKKKQSKISDFKVGQTVLAMGYLKEDQSLDCRRLVYTESKLVENTNQIITGQIVDISQSQNIFVIIPIQNKNSQYQIKTDSKTEITDFQKNKLTSAKTIATGKKVIVVIQPDPKLVNTFYAAKIIDLSPETTSTP